MKRIFATVSLAIALVVPAQAAYNMSDMAEGSNAVRQMQENMRAAQQGYPQQQQQQYQPRQQSPAPVYMPQATEDPNWAERQQQQRQQQETFERYQQHQLRLQAEQNQLLRQQVEQQVWHPQGQPSALQKQFGN